MKTTNDGLSIKNILTRSRRLRENGNWPAWKRHPVELVNARGWLSEVKVVAENGIFSVLIRTIEVHGIGEIIHAAISTADGATNLIWAERQRIKNELFGRERTAVEVMPPESELIDEANMYHLWIMPDGYLLPFTLAKRERIEK